MSFGVAIELAPRDGEGTVWAVLTSPMERVEVAEQVGELLRGIGDGELRTRDVATALHQVVAERGAVRLALREREGGADMRD
jgi:hypothetical protein